MTRFRNIAYIVLGLLLSLGYPPITDSQEVEPVTYRAEFIPFGEGLNLKEMFPAGGGALGLEVEFVFSPGTVTAEIAGEIRFSEDTRTLAIQGTGGQLKSDGGVVLKGDIVINFTVPLPEAFFQEDDDSHINYRVPIPGLNINKGWNESEEFDSLLLNSSRPESVKLDIRIPQLVTIQLSAVEIVPVVASAILSGGTLTTAVKVFVDNLSDYLDAGISLNGGIASELTLAGKTITLNEATITHENRLIRAPNFDPSGETYQIQSSYDEEFTYTLDIVASSNAYAKVVLLGGIEIWSYDEPFAEKQIPLISENTFDLNFGGAATTADIDIEPEPPAVQWLEDGVIPDPALADGIRRELNIWQNDLITRNDIRKLTELSVFRGVRNLTGLEHAINLTELYLYGNNAISEVSLSDMPNLEILNLSNNPLSKVSLSNMPSLTHLVGFYGNAISEVSLSDMPNLESLSFSESTISKLSMSGLTNLKRLSLYESTVSKLSLSDIPSLTELNLHGNLSEVSLSNLPNLKRLHLNNDKSISEVFLSDLPSLTYLNLQNNLLSEVSLSDLPNLTQLSLDNNLLSEVSLSNLPNLTYLNLQNNNISKVSLSGLTNLTQLHLRDNAISDVSPLSGLANLTELLLSRNAISDVSPLSGLTNLTHLYLSGNAISDVSPLSGLPNLTRLLLSDNAISDVSLSGLPNLTDLYLIRNAISDVSPLSGLTNLTELLLTDNAISDVSPLSGLTNLTDLSLSNNAISDVSLSNLPHLTKLHLAGNPLSDVSLSNLSSLTELNLSFNSISEVSISELPSLTELHLGSNSISEISLSDLPNLADLYLYANAISDVSGLSDLKNLEFLDLSNNAISDVSPLIEFPNLTQLYLPNNPLNFASRRTYIPAMQARRVFVWFDERVSPILVKISGEGQIGAPSLTLPTPFVVQALDVEDKPMSGIPIKFAVAQGRGELSTTTARTDATGKAQTTLTLGPNPGTNTVAVIAEGFERAVSFTATAVLDPVTPLPIAEDVNGDGVVNIQDLVLVSSNLGQVGENEADVNGDGVVNIQDLVQVSAALQ